MADQWLFKSETYDNCNCQINCGCQFNVPSTNGYCQSAYIGRIVEGHFNDTPLVGLNWAALYKWPGEIKDLNGKRQIVVDEREALDADLARRVERVLKLDIMLTRSADIFVQSEHLCKTGKPCFSATRSPWPQSPDQSDRLASAQ